MWHVAGSGKGEKRRKRRRGWVEAKSLRLLWLFMAYSRCKTALDIPNNT
jgi:hypothetical protein